MCDRHGGEIALVPPPQAKQAQPDATAKAVVPSDIARRLARLEKRALPFASDKLADVLATLIASSTAKPLLARIAALEKAIERQDATMLSEIERRAWKYKGYWEQSQIYRLNDVVTDAGSTWLALCDTKERPTFSSTTWRVIAKKGRDA